VKRLLVVAAVLVTGVTHAKADPPPESQKAEEIPAPPTPLDLAAKPPVVQKIAFTGNRKVEDDAVRVNLTTVVGAPLDREKLREDVRALWKMGFFEDVKVEATPAPGGGIVLTFAMFEKPSIRKILVQGNDELGLDKINEVLDLKRDSILDVAKVKKNTQKIHDLYISKGFYLASCDYQVRPISDTEVDVWLTVRENSKVQIRRISFTGNSKISSDELRHVMQTSEGTILSFMNDSGTFQQDVFERDLTLLLAYYYDQGYVTVKVGTPQVQLSADKRYMYINIPIEEGPAFDIGKVDMKGDLVMPKAEVIPRLLTKAGARFSRSRLGQDMQRVNDLYKDKGYAYVNVSPQTPINMDKRTVDIVFEIERGSKVYFERINIRGNTKTRDKVIRREMKIAEGELYSQTALDSSKARIQALGYFEKVDVSTKRGSSDEFIEVNVEVTEKPTGTFQIGAGFSSVESFIAQAQIAQNNLFGRGQTLTLQAQLSGLRQLFSLRFVEPYFFDTLWTFGVDLYNQTLLQTTFARNAYGGDLTWGYPLTYEAHAFLTYKLEQVGVSTSASGLIFSQGTTFTTSPHAVANLFRGGITSSLRAALTYDTRDNRLFPSRGLYDNLYVEVADTFTGSQNVFVKYGGFARFYQPIWGPFIFKTNVETGIITSRQAEGVPITERFILGGINDIRGFRLRTLTPVIAAQNPGEPGPLQALPLGGNLEIIWNNEIEFPIFKTVGISGVVFFDAGNAYNLEDKWCHPNSLSKKVDPCFSFPSSIIEGSRQSVGFGFRWFSPIGPLRFEWGIPLDRQPGEDPLVFEFTIGNFF
jgi:outer membrane protein insertion porin family